MTLDEMNAWLADKGFAVTRERDSIRNLYVFTICKGDCFTRGEFKYPNETSYGRRRDLMVKFMESLVDKFYRDHNYKEENKMNPFNPCYTLVDDAGKRIPVVIDTLTQTPGQSDTFTGHVVGTKYDLSFIAARGNGKSQLQMEMYRHMLNSTYGMPKSGVPRIQRVIHNDPATIVFWADGTKTVVKCQPGDIYDPEKGLAMAISKKALGNQGNYCNVFKEWLPEEKPCEEPEMISRLENLMKAARHVLAAKALLTDSEDPGMYHPITEHYGYVLGFDEEWPYIICHKDEAHLTRDPNHYECFFKTREFQNVKAECTNLESRHYPEASDV